MSQLMDLNLVLSDLLYEYMFVVMCQNEELQNSCTECLGIILGGRVVLYDILCLFYSFPKCF